MRPGFIGGMEKGRGVKVGFTGTQVGMTEEQGRTFLSVIREVYPEITEFHHGDCVGADKHAHTIISKIISKESEVEIIIHPPSNPKKRAFCESENIKEPLPYIERNHNIVDSCDVLIATPKENKEVVRSGTWATIRYARKKKKEVYIIFRNGITSIEKNK